MPDCGKEVLINLLAVASYDHLTNCPIQFMTKGNLLYSNPTDAVISYTESLQDEATKEITTSDVRLIIGQGSVTMERRGSFSNTMVFSPGRRFEGKYMTPYGELPLAVFSRGVQLNIGEKKGAIHLNYQLDLQGAYASTNELHLEYNTDTQENETV